MNSTVTKTDLIDKISEKLSNKRFIRGGNTKSWISKYHLNYAKEDVIKPVLNAYLDVLIEAIVNGESVKIYDYFKIEPYYVKEKSLNVFGFNKTHINKRIPSHYKIKFTPGAKMKEALHKIKKKDNE